MSILYADRHCKTDRLVIYTTINPEGKNTQCTNTNNQPVNQKLMLAHKSSRLGKTTAYITSPSCMQTDTAKWIDSQYKQQSTKKEQCSVPHVHQASSRSLPTSQNNVPPKSGGIIKRHATHNHYSPGFHVKC
jgi:hypothetical protein